MPYSLKLICCQLGMLRLMFLFGNFSYQKVIESCALQPEIDMLPAGDAEVNVSVW